MKVSGKEGREGMRKIGQGVGRCESLGSVGSGKIRVYRRGR